MPVNFAPREVLTAAKLNLALGEKASVAALILKADVASLAGKADLADGVLRTDQIPGFLVQDIVDAQAAADGAQEDANQAGLAAAAANDAATAAQETADAAVGGLASKVPNSARGVALGVATLDEGGKIPLSQIPEGVGGGGGSNPDADLVPPLAAMFTWVNPGQELTGTDRSMTDTPRGLVVSAEGNSSQTMRMLTRPAPGPHWRVTTCIEFPALVALYVGAGLACRQSASGRVEQADWIPAYQADYQIWHRQLLVLRWSSTTAVDSVAASKGVLVGSRLWQRCTEDGAQRLHEVSADGLHWMRVSNTASTEFLTADEVGVAFSCLLGLFVPVRSEFTIRHWHEEVLP